jgi:hypothetical protein
MLRLIFSGGQPLYKSTNHIQGPRVFEDALNMVQFGLSKCSNACSILKPQIGDLMIRVSTLFVPRALAFRLNHPVMHGREPTEARGFSKYVRASA